MIVRVDDYRISRVIKTTGEWKREEEQRRFVTEYTKEDIIRE